MPPAPGTAARAIEFPDDLDLAFAAGLLSNGGLRRKAAATVFELSIVKLPATGPHLAHMQASEPPTAALLDLPPPPPLPRPEPPASPRLKSARGAAFQWSAAGPAGPPTAATLVDHEAAYRIVEDGFWPGEPQSPASLRPLNGHGVPPAPADAGPAQVVPQALGKRATALAGASSRMYDVADAADAADDDVDFLRTFDQARRRAAFL